MSDRFLGGALKDRSLAAVAEFAANETSLGTVQQFVRDLFEPFGPATFHKFLPTFRWKAIATTNYDLIVERSYRDVSDRLQTPVKRFKDGDSFDHRFKQEADDAHRGDLHGIGEPVLSAPSGELCRNTKSYHARDNQIY